MSYVPEPLPNDTLEWLAQVKRRRNALEVSVLSMPGMIEADVSAILNVIETTCRQLAVRKHLQR